MTDDISEKDKKDWLNFINSKEKVSNKDQNYEKKINSKIKKIDLHGYTLDEANKTIENFIIQSFS